MLISALSLADLFSTLLSWAADTDHVTWEKAKTTASGREDDMWTHAGKVRNMSRKNETTKFSQQLSGSDNPAKLNVALMSSISTAEKVVRR